MEVRTYGQYCPVARASEIVAMRWTPIIVRNLLLGARTFGEIHDGAPGIPRTLLSQRLRLLEQHGIVERLPGRRYGLTVAGRELEGVIDALGVWGSRWLELAPEHLDAGVVLWAMCRHVEPDDVPGPRLVIRFDVADDRRRHFWVVLAPPSPRSASSRRDSTRTSWSRPAPSGWRSGTWAGSRSAPRCTTA